ncbi:SusC/RagA family TonB-linked outer membrane protein [Mucilaginibacter aquaedulcis]|uniref:SusC/RagA family TonB-linked outer membrane protein n=1 Tax=Mucilaginibacter aquaedulcis TaxID=1187081 RepID=UPI0025B5941D|nr:TonB-dependent receptor [Mucilaginibacter aquaedulcis]MDN3548802.1 TonB-dependent receptor [Mucilaginibacter aquaedulcis]
MCKTSNDAILRKKSFYLLIFALLSTNVALGQSARKIRGRVVDDSNAPLPGVAILVKGTRIGATTNVNGEYFINADAPSILIFGLLGYKTKEEVVGDRQIVDVNLKMTITGLQEVNVSYGKQRSREITGAITQINAEPLQDMPVGQFAQQLQGKVAGVQVSQTSGQPGRGMAFRIRGAASLASGYQPLFVIDGLPITGSINNINPDEIESFTVLKDAASTALYGSRAANGVVLITTKHAKPGDSKITLNSNFGIQAIPMNKVPKMMNANQFATFMNERYQDQVRYEGVKTPIDTTYANPSKYGAGTNWFQALTREAPIQRYDLTILTAHERSTSSVIAGYQAQDGVIVNSGTKLFSLRINQDLTLTDGKLKIGFNLAPSYRLDHNNRLATDGVGGLFERFFEASPLRPIYNPDGSYYKNAYSNGMVSYINPLAQLMLNKDDYITTRILGNAFFNYELLPGLSFKTNAGVDKGAETRNQFTPSAIITTQATGIASSVDNYSWTAETNLQYHKTIVKDHNIEALVGYSAQRFNQVSTLLNGTGFPDDNITYLSAATSYPAGSGATATGSFTTAYSLLSAIGRLNYNYEGKYLLQGAIRRDGSSRFGEDRKYGYFPSVSAGWIISDEPFMEKLKSIDLLKVRASYGITGNNDIGNYTAISQLGNYNYVFNGVSAPGQTIGTLGNPNLAWERNKQLDLAVDVSLLRGRIGFIYDYYHKITDGMIQARPLPRASGFTTINYNVGAFAFWGHEFTLNTVNTTGKIKWSSNLNVSVDRNIIKSMVSPGFIRRNNTVTSDYFRNQVGHHLGEFYGFVHEGLYKDAADLANSPKYNSGAQFSDIGTLKMKDINGDGKIDDVNDRTFIGNPTPDFTFGFTNNFTYKNFDLNITMTGQIGGKILNAAKWAYQTNMDGSRLPLAAALDHWRSAEAPGSGIYPRTETNTTAIGREVNTQWVENGTYLTVKNIVLGYTFKLKKSKLLLKSLRVYGSVQQAFIITGYSGMNPEISLSGLDATQGIGVDENAYPVPRTFSIGIQTAFK